jgi:hypothetical protein
VAANAGASLRNHPDAAGHLYLPLHRLPGLDQQRLRPDILPWLSAMDDREAACVMEAMRSAFPPLSGNTEW